MSTRAGTPDAILTAHTPHVRALAERLRALVRDAMPDAREVAYPGWHAIGYRHPTSGYVCGIFPLRDRVRLVFEHGVELPDPLGVLRGDGTQVRYVEARRRADIQIGALRALLHAAVGLRARRAVVPRTQRHA